MCACGCGDGFGRQFPGPKGIVYELTVYSGCSNCDTPAGFFIRRIRKADCDYLELMEPLEFNEQDDFAQPMACPRRILKELSRVMEGLRVLDPNSGIDVPESFSEWADIAHPEPLDAIRDGIRESIEKGGPDEG